MLVRGKEEQYPDCHVSSWDESNESCHEEYAVWHIHYWGSNIDESVWQCWGDSEKEHVVQQLLSSLGNL